MSTEMRTERKIFVHSPEEVASGPRILCWVMFFHYLSLASLNGLVLYTLQLALEWYSTQNNQADHNSIHKTKEQTT